MELDFGHASEEYRRIVLDDLKRYEKLNHPV